LEKRDRRVPKKWSGFQALAIGDIDIRWTKLYKRFAYSNENADADCINLIHEAINLRNAGPKLKVPLPVLNNENLSPPTNFAQLPACEQCANHHPDVVADAMAKYFSERNLNAPLGIESQVMIFSQDDDSWSPDGNCFDETTLEVTDHVSPGISAYEHCKARFTECCHLADDSGADAIKALAELLDSFQIGLCRKLTENKAASNCTPGSFRSIAIDSSKRKIHHGTRHYRQQCMLVTKKHRHSAPADNRP
jgi:hypothetical protein